jgi:hypothetical protein
MIRQGVGYRFQKIANRQDLAVGLCQFAANFSAQVNAGIGLRHISHVLHLPQSVMRLFALARGVRL